MSEKTQRPLLQRLGKELNVLGSELRESVALRWQLALLEIKADLRLSRQVLLFMAVAFVMVLTALPLLLAALAHWLARSSGPSAAGWMAIFGALLAVSAPIIGFLAWRRLRRRFIGLEQTLEELHEDAVWLRERMEDSRQ